MKTAALFLSWTLAQEDNRATALLLLPTLLPVVVRPPTSSLLSLLPFLLFPPRRLQLPPSSRVCSPSILYTRAEVRFPLREREESEGRRRCSGRPKVASHKSIQKSAGHLLQSAVDPFDWRGNKCDRRSVRE